MQQKQLNHTVKYSPKMNNDHLKCQVTNDYGNYCTIFWWIVISYFPNHLTTNHVLQTQPWRLEHHQHMFNRTTLSYPKSFAKQMYLNTKKHDMFPPLPPKQLQTKPSKPHHTAQNPNRTPPPPPRKRFGPVKCFVSSPDAFRLHREETFKHFGPQRPEGGGGCCFFFIVLFRWTLVILGMFLFVVMFDVKFEFVGVVVDDFIWNWVKQPANMVCVKIRC